MLPFIAPRPRFRGIAKANIVSYVPASNETVHWGYFSRSLPPIVEIGSEDCVTLECLTHQAGDDPARMILGDQGVESVYRWTKERKAVNRRGAGPLDAPNGAGGGEGVHILTGPVRVRSAQPGDVLEVRILDMRPRPSGNPKTPPQDLRNQSGGELGIGLSRSDRGTEAAPGCHDLRNRHCARRRTGSAALQLPLGPGHRSRWCPSHRLRLSRFDRRSRRV